MPQNLHLDQFCFPIKNTSTSPFKISGNAPGFATILCKLSLPIPTMTFPLLLLQTVFHDILLNSCFIERCIWWPTICTPVELKQHAVWFKIKKFFHKILNDGTGGTGGGGCILYSILFKQTSSITCEKITLFSRIFLVHSFSISVDSREPTVHFRKRKDMTPRLAFDNIVSRDGSNLLQ